MDDSSETQQVMIDDSEENFIKPNDAVEVEINDDDMPMDDDDDGEIVNGEAGDMDTSEDANGKPGAHPRDMSIQTITSHNSSSVYAVASYYNKATNALTIITGGGDDRAFLHKLDHANTLGTVPLAHAHKDSVSSVASNEKYIAEGADLSKTPKYVAVGSYDGSIILYDPADGKEVKALDGPTDVEFLAFHPKGGSVLLAGSISDATVWMYHLPSSKCLQVFVGHECNGESGGVTSGTFTPDGKFALTIGMDGTMRIWAPRTGMCRHVFKLYEGSVGGGEIGPPGLTCLAVDGGSDRQLAITGGEDGNAHVVHLQSKKVVATLRHFDTIASQGADEDDEVMITSVEAVGFAGNSVNPNWVATGGSDGKLKIWDLTHGEGGQCRQICAVKEETDNSPASTGGITKISWHPTQPVIFASYTDGAVRLWDARNGQLVNTLTGGKSDNQINDISLEVFGTDAGAPGTAIVVAGHDDGNTKVFNVDVASVLRASTN